MVPPQVMDRSHPVKCVAIMGATATGKSDAAIVLCERFGGEVISMDSRQVYRGMNIGTGKVTPSQQRRVRHHLIDILDPDQKSSAGEHAGRARAAIRDIAARECVPFLVGGTGLYFDALFHPLIDVAIPTERLETIRATFEGRETAALYEELRRVDAARAEELSPNDRVRITRALEVFHATRVPMSQHFTERAPEEARAVDAIKFVFTMPRERLRDTIAARTRDMFANGWIDEVARLLKGGCRTDTPGMYSLGYAEIASALLAGEDPAGVITSVVTRTQQYAKRQETFFRKDPSAIWMDVTGPRYLEHLGREVAAFLGSE